MANAKNTILTTEDANIFKFLKHNRPVVQSHVARLAQSMQDKPHLFPARPILVNENMEVIDGQHRLKGATFNKQTIYYMVVDGLTIEDARLLNALQRTWSLLDYAYSYASSGETVYVDFIKTYEAHELPPSVVMEYMTGAQSRQRYMFRIGEFEPIEKKLYLERMSNLSDLQDHTKEWASYKFGMAFDTVQKTEGYDHQRMLKKLNGVKIEGKADRVDYIRELERIYNADFPFSSPSYLRFF